MKAVIWTGYGSPDVLQLKDVGKPSPKANEVLIKIMATTVTSGDCEQRRLALPWWQRLAMQVYVGIQKPSRITILGMELAGEIETVGKNVKRFKTGDSVFASTGFVSMGTYAQYICLPEEPEQGAIAFKPVNMTYAEATPVPVGGLEALYFLRQGNIQDGQKVLIIGAGGTIGTFAVQLAKQFGAEVTAVDSNEKMNMLRTIGADRIIDYTQEDFTKSGETYDLIVDIAGRSSFLQCLKSLKRNGCYLIANPRLFQIIRGKWTTMTSDKRVMFGATHPKVEDLDYLRELIEVGKLVSVIDRQYPLERIHEAHRYVEDGNKIGHVVVVLEHND